MNHENINGTEIINLDFISLVCSDPKQYTINGTFIEVANFIDGILDIINTICPALVVTFYGFLKWLPNRLEYPDNYLWYYVVRKKCVDDNAAFEQLILLFNEYIGTLKTKPSCNCF